MILDLLKFKIITFFISYLDKKWDDDFKQKLIYKSYMVQRK